MKSAEMTVLRAIGFIDLWDKEIKRDQWTGKYNNWDDVDPKKYRKLLGEGAYSKTAMLIEMFARYRDKRLHQEVLDLAENLDLEAMPAKRRKELKDGLSRIRSQIDR